MLYLVAYDVSDPRRLHRVAQACEDFGVRVQYSIFEAHLDEKDFQRFWLRLIDEIDEDEDRRDALARSL
jgi:CRISPR-associated protein Cas2